VILISGPQGSGKTSLRSELYTRLPLSAKYRFANPLYEIHDSLQAIMAKIHPEITCSARGIPKDGPLLQVIGTEWARAFDPDIWMKIAIKQVNSMLARGLSPVIIDDCRFRNEFHAFDYLNPFTVRLECSAKTRQERCSMWRDNATHPSEIDLDEYAAAGMFDLLCNTENFDIEVLGDKVLQALE